MTDNNEDRDVHVVCRLDEMKFLTDEDWNSLGYCDYQLLWSVVQEVSLGPGENSLRRNLQIFPFVNRSMKS